MINNVKIGSYGENIAMNHLKEKGYQLRCKNYRTRHGEIDIIMQKNNILCFIEVKTRYNSKFGSPCQCINYRKKSNIIKTSQFYISAEKLFKFNVRYDVIEVILNYNDDSFHLNHIESAF